jgi:DNA-binding transcriptional MerR regulator
MLMGIIVHNFIHVNGHNSIVGYILPLLTSIKYYFILYIMKRLDLKGLVKISELAKAAGVSPSTIHYYVQEGLLTKPAKTSRNMAYYDPRSAEDIRLIQELQAKKFLPLSAIKLIIKAKREGQAIEHVGEMQSFMENIFQPVENEISPGKITLSELVKGAGLDRSVIKAVEARGFIQPVKTAHGAVYTDIDVGIARTFKKLAGFGLKLDDLDIYRRHLELFLAEAKAMHAVFHKLPEHEKVPFTEIFKTVKEFRDYLALRVIRQEAGRFHEHDNR